MRGEATGNSVQLQPDSDRKTDQYLHWSVFCLPFLTLYRRPGVPDLSEHHHPQVGKGMGWESAAARPASAQLGPPAAVLLDNHRGYLWNHPRSHSLEPAEWRQ